MNSKKFLTINGVIESGFDYYKTAIPPLKSYKPTYLSVIYDELYYYYLGKLSKLNQNFILTKIHIDNINDIIKYYENKEEYKRCSLLKLSLDKIKNDKS